MGTIYTFDTEYAKKYGTNEAVILQNIIFWVKKNKANNKHLHEGKHWTYNSVKAFNELFDLLTKDQIRTCLEKLEAESAIIKSNFNENAYDRTLWYTLFDELYNKHIDNNHLAKMPDGLGENPKAHLANLPNGLGENATPIPYINTIFKQADKRHTQEHVCVDSTEQLKDEIKRVTGYDVHKKVIASLLTVSNPDRIRYHLSNWHIHKKHQKGEGAGWLFAVVNYDIQTVEQQKIICASEKIPQRGSFDQREYSDEYLESFYANSKEV